MGQTDSSPDYGSEALEFYSKALWTPCLLPDIGIDESLLKYSGTDSNAVLQAHSKEMLNTVPRYVGSFGSAIGDLTPFLDPELQTYSGEMLKTVPGYTRSLGSAIGSLTSVPNAVGLGALVISLIIEIAIKSTTPKSDPTYGLLRRVFGEEKASHVRDTMSEYLRRHRMYMGNEQRLREEISRLEKQLSNELTKLRNSLLKDGQMSSRGFKIWVNGAAFYVQMLIHEARLNIQTGKPASDYLNAIETAIDLYLQDLDYMLEKYKTYKINSGIFWYSRDVIVPALDASFYMPATCTMKNQEIQKCELVTREFKYSEYKYDCSDTKMATTFMEVVYYNYEPIKGLKSYFKNIKNDLNSLIHERGSFTVPSAAG